MINASPTTPNFNSALPLLFVTAWLSALALGLHATVQSLQVTGEYQALLLAALALWSICQLVEQARTERIWAIAGLLMATGLAAGYSAALYYDIRLVTLFILFVFSPLMIIVLFDVRPPGLALVALALAAAATPGWYLIAPQLQYAASAGTSWMLQPLGLTVLIEDQMIHLPSGSLVIEEGCAGTNYLYAGILLSLATSVWYRLKLLGSLVLTAIAALTAIIANWLRITLIVVIADQTAMQSSLVENHATLGWFVFAFTVMPILLWLYPKLADYQDTMLPAKPTQRLIRTLAERPVWCFAMLLPLHLGQAWVYLSVQAG